MSRAVIIALATLIAFAPAASSSEVAAPPSAEVFDDIRYGTVNVDGLNIFYREAGLQTGPVIVLLHGFPTSSHMFRNLMPRLASRYRVIAPDYPGYGYSDAPAAGQFDYSFDNLAQVISRFIEAKGVERYALYMQDFGGPVGFRLATAQPERVTALIVQNANAYEQGFSQAMEAVRPAWSERTPETEAAFRKLLVLEATRDQFLAGVSDPRRVSPDSWAHAQSGLDRPGNEAIQQALLHDYGSNPRLYPVWQAYLRRHRPPTLIVWGAGDLFFVPAGARAYLGDVPDAELHLLDTGHFALETHAGKIAALMIDFLDRRLDRE